MRQFVSILSFILLSTASAIAQPPLLINDEFTGYRAHWETLPVEQARVSQGVLYLHQAEPTGELRYVVEQYMAIRENFTLTAEVTLSPNTPTGQIGICWGGTEDGYAYYALLLRADGYFSIIRRKGDQEQTLLDWQRGSRLRKPGKPNEITVRRVDWGIYIDFNGKENARVDFQRYFGTFHGLIVRERAEVAVEYFRLFHAEVKPYLAAGMWGKALKQPLDTPINHIQTHERAPQLSYTGRQLFFARADTSQGIFRGEMMLTQVQGDTMWAPARPVNGPQKGNQQLVVALSRQTRNLWALTHLPNGRTELAAWAGQDIAWTLTEQLKIGFGTQRLPVDACLSEDRQTVVFAAELPGGQGGRDLWMSHRNNNGSWSKPQNLGEVINSFGDEGTPFWEDSTRTLYFSTDGRPGYGRRDVFRSEAQGRGWQRWSEPANLGPRINTAGNDLDYTPLPNRPRQAYMASPHPKRGDLDLYSVLVPRDLTAEGLVRLKGRVVNRSSGSPAEGFTISAARIRSDSLEVVQQVQVKSDTFTMLVPFGDSYQIYASRPGFYPIGDTLNLRPIEVTQVIERDLYVEPITAGRTITLERVYFKRAKDELLPDSYSELTNLLTLMRENPSLEIEILGHTDSLGQEAQLVRLSEARAHRVRDYLIEHGIRGARVTAQGFGSSQPVASNANPKPDALIVEWSFAL